MCYLLLHVHFETKVLRIEISAFLPESIKLNFHGPKRKYEPNSYIPATAEEFLIILITHYLFIGLFLQSECTH